MNHAWQSTNWYKSLLHGKCGFEPRPLCEVN